MRLFIALDFEELRDYFKGLQSKIDSSLAKVSLTNAYHITLKFLGEVEESKVDKIKEALGTVNFEQLKLTLSGIGFFPSENYIRVVWVGIKENDIVNELQKRVDVALEKMFSRDKRFHPHITLARVKFVKDRENFVKSLKELKVEEKKIIIDKIKLIKSVLGREGAVYETVEEFPQSL